jgi:hypothetical protein
MSLLLLMAELEQDLATAIRAIPATSSVQDLEPVAKIAEIAIAEPHRLNPKDESTLRTWLIADGDSPEGVEEVLACCARDPQARDYFLAIAKHFLEKART